MDKNTFVSKANGDELWPFENIIVGVLEPLWAYICPMLVTIGVYLSNACNYRRIFVQCLSLSAYICPMPVTIGVYLSDACHYGLQPMRTKWPRPTFVDIPLQETIYISISLQDTHMYNPSMWLVMFCTLLGGIHARLLDYRRICLGSGPPQHAPEVRMTCILTNSLK